MKKIKQTNEHIDGCKRLAQKDGVCVVVANQSIGQIKDITTADVSESIDPIAIQTVLGILYEAECDCKEDSFINYSMTKDRWVCN